ncbi:dehydrodolichyl diphosphate synthase, partial [Guillardia theta CCMP2712]
MKKGVVRWSKRLARFLVSRVLRCGPIPKHVAFIMDGNRRSGGSRRMKRLSEGQEGHAYGFLQLKECLKWCLDLGIKVVTVYAFSLENFKRSAVEVETIMKLAEEKLNELAEERGFLDRHGIKVQILGDLDVLPQHVKAAACRAMKVSEHHEQAVLNICIAYTSLANMAEAVEDGTLKPDDVTDELFSESLYTRPVSQVDLLVRTSGETRLSDFLLWQSACACVQFQPVLWPDFSLWHLASAILQYQRSFSDLQ